MLRLCRCGGGYLTFLHHVECLSVERSVSGSWCFRCSFFSCWAVHVLPLVAESCFSCLISGGFLAWCYCWLQMLITLTFNQLFSFFFFFTVCCLIIYFIFFFSISAPSQKRFNFLRSKSQEKLLPSPSSSSSRPSLSLTRRLRFWSSTDIWQHH